MDETFQVVIVGAGPAGVAAAVYCSEFMLNVLLVGEIGGQLLNTIELENYPGYSDKKADLFCDHLKRQISNYKVKHIIDKISELDLTNRPFTITFENGRQVKTQSVIIASGSTAKRLGLPNEERFYNKGISVCAVCDGSLYKRQPVGIVGGGNTAIEDALFMAKRAFSVDIFVRSGVLRASPVLVSKLKEYSNVTIHYHTEVVKVDGDERLETIKVYQEYTDDTTEYGGSWVLPVKALFYAIGHTPNVSFLKGELALDEGHIKVDEKQHTSVEGVFACGDVSDRKYKQAIVAAGQGTVAAYSCREFLEFSSG